MTLHVTLAEAQGRLAELVARVREGEEVLIDEDGRPVARLGPAQQASDAVSEAPKRRIGVWSHLRVRFDEQNFLKPDPGLEASMDEPVVPRP